MKRMSDVFVLPLTQENGVVTEASGNQCGEFNLASESKYAAHAINHADALADALELLLSDKAMIHVGNDKHLQARAALAAYMGEA
jgi:hypothetical protein